MNGPTEANAADDAAENVLATKVRRIRGPWDDWQNAELYEGFVRAYPIYRELNGRLAQRADLAGARRVLDVACGTGATARACLRLMPPDSDLVGVDASEAMVSVAASATLDPRARFRVAPAADVERVVGDLAPFDRALSSAALWQFPAPARVMEAVSKLLGCGGMFVFNVPAHRLSDQETPVHALQVALASAVQERLGRRHQPAPELHTCDLRRWLEAAGFDTVEHVRHVVRTSHDELLELMRIPAMAARMAPDLDRGQRHDVLEDAAQRVDLGDEVDVPWIDFIARKSAV